MEERSTIQCDINTANLPQQTRLTLEAQYRHRGQDSQHNTFTFLLFSDSRVILAIAGITLSVDPLQNELSTLSIGTQRLYCCGKGPWRASDPMRNLAQSLPFSQ